MKKSLTPLGETEMEVLNRVWELQEATVKQVHEEILKQRKVAYTTIMTVMKNLAEKGYLDYRKEGVSYVYRPAREPDKVRHSLLHGLLSKVFKGSPSALVQNLVEHESLSDEERLEIKRMIDKMKS